MSTARTNRRRQRPSSEAGFTLIELLVAIAISLVIAGPISAAVIIGLRTTGSSSTQLSQTRDIELVQGQLPRDMFSAQTVLANVAAGSTCAGKQSLLKITWSVPTVQTPGGPPTLTFKYYEVDYYLQATAPATNPPTNSLVRSYFLLTGTPPSLACPAQPTSTSVLANFLNEHSNQQSAVVSNATATLTLTDSSCDRFAASAEARATTSTGATTTTTQPTFPACTP